MVVAQHCEYINAANGKFHYVCFTKEDGTSPLCHSEKSGLRKKPIVRNTEQKNGANLATYDKVGLLNQHALGSAVLPGILL